MKNFGGVLFLFQPGQRVGNTAEMGGFPLSFMNPSELTCESTGIYQGKTDWHAVCNGSPPPYLIASESF
jgi:hypothetical protein